MASIITNYPIEIFGKGNEAKKEAQLFVKDKNNRSRKWRWVVESSKGIYYAVARPKK